MSPKYIPPYAGEVRRQYYIREDGKHMQQISVRNADNTAWVMFNHWDFKFNEETAAPYIQKVQDEIAAKKEQSNG